MILLRDMLLIEEPSVLKLYKEMLSIAYYFIAPVFTIALILEYFGNLDFGQVVKKLLIICLFMGAFYEIHRHGVELSLESSSEILKKVSPRNLFVKKWTQTKVKTESNNKKTSSFIDSWAIPNLNDLIATSFFILSKVFIWLLKLIYSTVYHLTYVFSGVTAILYFLGWTKDALKGTVQASLWCMLMPFVVVAVLALVGNSIDEAALKGDLIVAKIDTIIWLFGVTLLLLISPAITFGMIKGEGIHAFSKQMSSQIIGAGMRATSLLPMMSNVKESKLFRSVFRDSSNKSQNFKSRSERHKSSATNNLAESKSNSQTKSKENNNKEKNNEQKIQSHMAKENRTKQDSFRTFQNDKKASSIKIHDQKSIPHVGTNKVFRPSSLNREVITKESKNFTEQKQSRKSSQVTRNLTVKNDPKIKRRKQNGI